MTMPPIDYTARDFTSMKSALLAFAAQQMPEWVPQSEGDFGVLMTELFSYQGDMFQYYLDRSQYESYLSTATQRNSILNIARTLGYTPHNAIPATGPITFVTSNPGNAVTIPAGTQFTTTFVSSLDRPVIFELMNSTTVPSNGGTAAATLIEGQTLTGVRIGVSTGTAGQTFQLPSLAVIDGTTSISVQTVFGTQTWTVISDLVEAGPSDAVYAVYTDAQGLTWITFGDAVNGAIPSIGLTISASYRVGGGTYGNAPAGSVTGFASPITGVAIQQLSTGQYVDGPFTGGADPESNDSIRNNARLAYRTQGRAVTLQDFANLALAVPGVTKAVAVGNHYTSVTIYVLGPGGSPPSTVLVTNIQNALATDLEAGTSLTISNAVTITVNIGSSGSPCTLWVLPKFNQAEVLANVQAALLAFFDPAAVNFGMTISLYDIYASVAGVSGVDHLDITVFTRTDQVQTGVTDIVFRPFEIPVAGTITINATGGI